MTTCLFPWHDHVPREGIPDLARDHVPRHDHVHASFFGNVVASTRRHTLQVGSSIKSRQGRACRVLAVYFRPLALHVDCVNDLDRVNTELCFRSVT